VRLGSLKTLREGREQIETGSLQEPKTPTINIKVKLGDKWKQTYKDRENQD